MCVIQLHGPTLEYVLLLDYWCFQLFNCTIIWYDIHKICFGFASKTPWNQFLIIRRILVQHKLKSRKKVCHHSPFIVLSCCIQPQLIQHWFFVIFTQRDREQSKKMPSNVHTKQKNIWPQSPFACAWRQGQPTFSISKCSLRKHNKNFPHFFSKIRVYFDIKNWSQIYAHSVPYG